MNVKKSILMAQALVVLGAALMVPADLSAEEKDGSWERPLLLGAHRGGAGEWPESTLLTYTEVSKLYPEILLEGDLRLSSDGEVVVIHDETVDRTTNGTGAVESMTLAQLKTLDAAYKFSTDGGKTFPHRGKGIAIPTFDEVLAAIPQHRFLFELKGGDGLVDKVVPIIRKHAAADRIIIASFKPALMKELRSQMSDIATCYDMLGAMALITALRAGDWDTYVPIDKMLSFPKKYAAQFQLTGEDIKRLQGKGILVQVHTLDTDEEIQHFLDMGVDSILTDYPSRLAAHRTPVPE